MSSITTNHTEPDTSLISGQIVTDYALTSHTVAVFGHHRQAEEAVKELAAAGFSMRNLSIVGQNYHTEEHPVGFISTGDRMWSWGKLGAFWGSIWGLLFGSAMLFVPGVGTLMFAGWIVAALEGALLGGGITALGAALGSIGIPENSVVKYESAISSGSFVLMVHGTDEEIKKAQDILKKTEATDLGEFSSADRLPVGSH